MRAAFISLAIISIFFLCSQALHAQVPELPAQLTLDAKCTLGEGSIWQPQQQRLYWIDIEGKDLHIYDPVSKTDRVLPVGTRIGTVVPTQDGNAIVALQNGIHKINTTTGALQFLTNPLPDTTVRFNDGKCDPAGRFWVGTMAMDERRKGAVLFRIDNNREVRIMLDSVTISNGIVWTADKKAMYYNDTPTGTVQGFDYDNETGGLSNRHVVVRIPKGMGAPDGMTIDADDNIWVALWGGACAAKFDPRTGQLLQKINVPAPNVTSCAFGGSGLDTLYITTARSLMNEQQLKTYPHSGGLFMVVPGVKGVPASFYKGQ